MLNQLITRHGIGPWREELGAIKRRTAGVNGHQRFPNEILGVRTAPTQALAIVGAQAYGELRDCSPASGLDGSATSRRRLVAPGRIFHELAASTYYQSSCLITLKSRELIRFTTRLARRKLTPERTSE